MNKETQKVHFIYWICILVAIIIVLITGKFGEDDKLVNYLEFGLALTSLFVGLIAIFQTLFSGNSLDNSIGTLDKSSKTIIDNAANLTTIIGALDSKLNDMPTYFQGLETKISEIKQTANSIPANQTDTTFSLNQKEIDQFLPKSSAVGLIVLYGCSLSFNAKKPIPKDYFEDTTFGITFNYSYGFIVACQGIDILQIIINKDDKVEVQTMSQLFINSLEKHIAKFPTDIGKKFEPGFTTAKTRFEALINSLPSD